MSGLILGTTKGIDPKDLIPWAYTAIKTNNKVVLIAVDFNDYTKLEELGVEIVRKEFNNRLSPHNQRFLLQYEYLMDSDCEYAITTDVRDVIFQHDPIIWLNNNLGNYKVVCASEGLLYKDEPWGNNNLIEGFPYLYDRYKSNLIMNVGVVGGKTKELASINLAIYTMCLHNPAYLSDQSSFNILCGMDAFSSIIYKSESRAGFALHSGTFLRNCTTGEFRLNDNNCHLLKEPEPVLDNSFRTCDGIPYCIVHQWNRTNINLNLL